MPAIRIVDSHVHFWDPEALAYPWLSGLPALRRPFLPVDYREHTAGIPIERVVFVEANPRPELALREVELVERLAESEPRVAAIVAYVNLLDEVALPRTLDALAAVPLVRGVRQNIQGHPAGFCLQPSFMAGVREAGRRGLTFDLCATHDQLGEVGELVRRCPDTRMVLDHCGKPPIRAGALDPWREHVREIAAAENVACKLSGLLTESDPSAWRDEDLLPYAEHVVESFGPARVMYGSDWPVLTLAGRYPDWYQFTRRFTTGWSARDLSRFYHENAAGFYRI